MTYPLLRYAHLVGLMLLGAGLIGVWIADLRSRKVRDLGLFAEAVRNIAVFYDGVVVPGAIILFVSGAWMTAEIGRHVYVFCVLFRRREHRHATLLHATPTPHERGAGTRRCDA